MKYFVFSTDSWDCIMYDSDRLSLYIADHSFTNEDGCLAYVLRNTGIAIPIEGVELYGRIFHDHLELCKNGKLHSIHVDLCSCKVYDFNVEIGVLKLEFPSAIVLYTNDEGVVVVTGDGECFQVTELAGKVCSLEQYRRSILMGV